MRSDGQNLVSPEVRGKLVRLRRAIHAHLLLDAAALGLVVLAAGVLATLALDWGLYQLTHEPIHRIQRAAASALAAGALGYVVWTRYARPRLTRLRMVDLALLVERRYPQLGDGLAGAVQFAEGEAAGEMSGEMIGRMAEEANRTAEGLDFGAVVDFRRLGGKVIGAAAAVALLAGLWAAAPETMGLWFRRNVLLAEVDWPQATYLEVEGGPDFAVVRGGDFVVRVRVAEKSRVMPREVALHLRYGTAERVEQMMHPARRMSEGGHEFVRAFSNVSQPFSFYASGNDGRTEVCRVEIVEPPELMRLTVEVEYPAYRGERARVYDGSRGSVTAPRGSVIVVQATATKELADARLMLDGAEVGECEISPGGEGGRREIAGRFRLDTAEKVRGGAAGLRVAMTDTEGVSSGGEANVMLHVIDDEPPTVQMQYLGLSRNVTPWASAPVRVEARDDVGIAALYAEQAVKGVSDEPAVALVERPGAGTRSVSGEYRLELDPLAGGGAARGGRAGALRVGEVVRIAVVAEDNLPMAAGGPNRSRSAWVELQVVSEEELLAELLRQQQEMRGRMQQAMDAQASARDRMRAARDMAGAGSEDWRRTAGQSARDQQTVAGFAASILQTYRNIAAILENNRAGDPGDRKAMNDRVIQPLARVSEGLIGAVLEDIRTAMDEGAESRPVEQLAEIARRQDELYREMDAVLGEMAQIENLQEISRALAGILNVAEEVNAGIEERLRSQAETLFDPVEEPRP